jgi:nitrate reductase gamma subunit
MTGAFFFIALPYMALVLLVGGTFYRYLNSGFKVSSLSSQLLESRILFFGSRPFHWGIVTLFFGHLIGFLIPSWVLAWNRIPARMYVLEITALAFALLLLTGLSVLIYRRFSVKRIKMVTTWMDVIVFIVLVMAVITGIYVAFFFRWGSSWFATIMAPYLLSILKMNPDITAIITLPFMVKLHIINAFVIFAIFPFTRLVHMIVYPLHYFFRAPQVVIWNRKRDKVAEIKR